MVELREGQLGGITVLDEDGYGAVTASGAKITNVASVVNIAQSEIPQTGAGNGAFWAGGSSPTVPKFTDSEGRTINLGGSSTIEWIELLDGYAPVTKTKLINIQPYINLGSESGIQARVVVHWVLGGGSNLVGSGLSVFYIHQEFLIAGGDGGGAIKTRDTRDFWPDLSGLNSNPEDYEIGLTWNTSPNIIEVELRRLTDTGSDDFTTSAVKVEIFGAWMLASN